MMNSKIFTKISLTAQFKKKESSIRFDEVKNFAGNEFRSIVCLFVQYQILYFPFQTWLTLFIDAIFCRHCFVPFLLYRVSTRKFIFGKNKFPLKFSILSINLIYGRISVRKFRVFNLSMKAFLSRLFNYYNFPVD